MRQLPEAPSQAGLQFSGATEEDFDEIMGISQGIDGGLDYLPTRYMDWLQETNRTVIVARKQGKVIAMESVFVIDDGETMLVQALRVAPQERGFQKYRLITKQGILLVRFRAEELKLRLSDLGLGDIQSSLSTSFKPPPVRLDNTAVRRLYLTSDRMLGVLSNATIIQDSQPFKLLPSNMAILLKKDIDWMVDDVASPTVTSLCTFPYRVPLGDDWYSLNINTFGTELDPVRQQFLCHLQRHTATLKGHVMCQLFLDPPLWKPMVEFCRNTLNVELVQEYAQQCVVESDVI
ncbi:hypothetical protein CesoFtcFv8_015626 [Champsocephalus esox]|uniref:Histidine N-acetyltransferase C-terminal domain-containing protein n=1 Tax=Champsocephalus esox TaxID=159716 RepID=A0AAN8BR52_9TELE|nr:hypothetical protein CesoFtcFv8_015626 [Champsocephalus esox]